MAELIRWARLWVLDIRAAWRIEHGWCPWCKSSPPAQDCPVCHEDYAYGPGVGDVKKKVWSERWIRATNR